MPPKLSSQPNMARSIVFFISLAPSPTSKITTIKTKRNEITGNHFVADTTFLPRYDATTADNLRAAARPIIKASKEKIPTTRPLVKPL